MKSEILHIYGPIAINSYGLFIALGVIAFLILVKHDKRYFQLNLENKLLDIIAVSIISGLAGGRLLFLLTEDTSGMSLIDMILPWVGGFSVLGGIIGILIILPFYLKHLKIPTLAFLDLAAIYAPLIHSISRIGCFFAGCCYGCATTLPWAVMYSDVKSFAPLNISIHPTQLYSSLILLAVFFLMYFIVQKKTFATGQILFVYLLLASTERFIVDFWRADRTILFDSPFGTLSHTQLIAIGMFVTSGILLFLVPRKRVK